jgi:endonuclease/exonuclease/phosphatase family metal-dependent hydrolase
MHHGPISKDIARGLQVLNKRIEAAQIPSSKLDETLNIATWNIREFGKRPRRKASLHYIAQIIGQFDLVCLVEVRDNVSDLSKVLQYLGDYWRVVFSDYVADPGGNRERLAFVYDHRAVTFTGLASQAQPPRSKSGSEYRSELSWWRPPYIASFRAGSFDFIVMATHIRWGDSEAQRLPELKLLADWVARRTREDYMGDKDVIVLGDLNIPSLNSPLFEAITSKGLRMPPALTGAPGTDLGKGKRYDQILHLPTFTKSFTGHGGVLDFYAGDHASLFPNEREMTKHEFTFELSDHLPLWVQLDTNIEDERLDQLLNPKRAA